MKRMIVGVLVGAVLGFASPLAASKQGDAAVRAWVQKSLAGELASLQQSGVLSLAGCTVTTGENHGWKRGHKVSFGVYSVVIQFPVKEGRDEAFRSRQGTINDILSIKATGGSFVAVTEWRGILHTREAGDGGVTVVSKDAFNDAVVSGKPADGPRGATNAGPKASGEEPVRERIVVQRIPVYTNLKVESFSVTMLETDGSRTVSAMARSRVEINGQFKCPGAMLELRFYFKDGSQQKRDDLRVTSVEALENAIVRSDDGGGHVLQVKSGTSFVARLEFITDEKFDGTVKLFLAMPVYINGNENTPLAVELPLTPAANPWIFIIGAVALLAIIVAVAGFRRNRGLNYGKVRCELIISSGSDTGKLITLDGETVVLGRMPETNNGIRIQSEKASRRHSMLTRTARGYMIADAGSTNGTFHNERKLDPGQTVLLGDGDRIGIGGIQLVYHISKR
ncbi:MAG TPA: FHA domain-containing protein [Spirochaetota bacterium]|nr:FHA domain-containing protein [Spirochaetota bacterium]